VVSELSEMECAGSADVSAELALGVLTGRERAAALEHLGYCAACQESVRRLTATAEKLLELLPDREPPAGFEARVMDRLGLVPVSCGCRSGGRRRRSRRWLGRRA